MLEKWSNWTAQCEIPRHLQLFVSLNSCFLGRQHSSGFFSLFAVHLVTQQLLDIVLFFVISQKWQGGSFPQYKVNGERWMVWAWPKCALSLYRGDWFTVRTLWLQSHQPQTFEQCYRSMRWTCLTPSEYCRNLLLVSCFPKSCRNFCLWASTVSTWVLYFTASSRALRRDRREQQTHRCVCGVDSVRDGSHLSQL